MLALVSAERGLRRRLTTRSCSLNSLIFQSRVFALSSQTTWDSILLQLVATCTRISVSRSLRGMWFPEQRLVRYGTELYPFSPTKRTNRRKGFEVESVERPMRRCLRCIDSSTDLWVKKATVSPRLLRVTVHLTRLMVAILTVD